jgi:hypothetical protein
VADWSFSSSATIHRHSSDDRISLARKWRRANVDFPDPDAPISTTRLTSGTLIVVVGAGRPAGLALGGALEAGSEVAAENGTG